MINTLFPHLSILPIAEGGFYLSFSLVVGLRAPPRARVRGRGGDAGLLDEVVVELIRCKTDNETLRQKIIDLNKEIYQLKNDLNSYKPIGMGFYKKKEKHIWE